MSDEQRNGRARGQLSADDPRGTGTTIADGQPLGASSRRPLRAVPVGIERVLYSAAIDPEFREVLFRDREEAIRARGIVLESSELAMLRLTPTEQLASAIAALDVSETNLARRGFMHAVAGAVTLAAGSVLAGCGEEPTRGIMPDLPRSFDSGGIRPGDRGASEAPPAAGGIRPDDIGLPEGKK